MLLSAVAIVLLLDSDSDVEVAVVVVALLLPANAIICFVVEQTQVIRIL
jgi:hypothetical protein